jgi:hypothetical protein
MTILRLTLLSGEVKDFETIWFNQEISDSAYSLHCGVFDPPVEHNGFEVTNVNFIDFSFENGNLVFMCSNTLDSIYKLDARKYPMICFRILTPSNISTIIFSV